MKDKLILGNLNFDGVVNVFDMTMMRKALIYGWNDTIAYRMADMTGDGYVNVADLVYMHRWLLGAIK
ncbi:MAG: dockerin type I repeat-containing protein [Clostridia bacterium]|nr:dockerin type I repeat-containing protein [Clostridia bacterium]